MGSSAATETPDILGFAMLLQMDLKIDCRGGPGVAATARKASPTSPAQPGFEPTIARNSHFFSTGVA